MLLKTARYAHVETLGEREEVCLNRKAFAEALVPYLPKGATVVTKEGSVWSQRVSIIMPNGLHIGLRVPYNKGKEHIVELLGSYDWRSMSNIRDHYTVPRLPDINVNSQREPEVVAADVKRRLLDVAEPVLADIKNKLAELERRNQKAQAGAEAFKLKFPKLNVQYNPSTLRTSVFSGDPYITGTLYEDGALQIDRIGSLTGKKRDAVVNVLLKKDA